MAPGHGDEDEHEEDDTKHNVAEFLENHWVESFVVFLVICDIILVAIEAGIDGGVLCVNGKVVPYGSPAGEHLAQHGGHGGASSFLVTSSLGIASQSVVSTTASRIAMDLFSFTATGLPSMPMLLLQYDAATNVGAAMMKPIKADPEFNGEPARGIVAGQRPNEYYQDQAEQQAEGESHRSGGGHHVESAPHHAAEGHESAHGAHGAAGAHGDGGHEGHGGGHHSLPEEVRVCETPEGHTAHHILHTCHTWSIIILCIFLVEIVLKIWVIPNYLANPFHKLDTAVVVLSLLVDTVVMWYIENERQKAHAAGGGEAADADSNQKKKQAEIIQGLLIMSRIWRVVRIAHGLFEQHHKQQELAGHGHGHHEASPSHSNQPSRTRSNV